MFVREIEKEISAEKIAACLSSKDGFAWMDSNGVSSEAANTTDRGLSFLTAFPEKTISIPWGNSDAFEAFSQMNAYPDLSHCEEIADLPFHPEEVPQWIGFVSYDAIWSDKKTSHLIHKREDSLPVLCFGKYVATFVCSQKNSRIWLVGINANACKKLLNLVTDDSSKDHSCSFKPLALKKPDFQRHQKAVEKALSEIKKGNIYQINLSQTWEGEFSGNPFALWQILRKTSPVPFGFYLAGGKQTIMARTMECFFNWNAKSRALYSKPIKGTVKRHGAHDQKEAEFLRADEKEMAEHSMIVDLMRNDLGRVAEPGSVAIENLMQVQPYAGLTHMVSTVQCKTKKECTLTNIFEALFPPGSITGTPKIEAIEWIEKLEAHARGIYTGCVGFVDYQGNASFAVAIRTAVAKKRTSNSNDPVYQIRYDAGGGIVESSSPKKETEESKLKAEFFLKAWKD